MRKGGGIIAVVAGSIGVIAAFMTLLFGGIGSALEAEGANTVIGLGWGGVASSFSEPDKVFLTSAVGLQSHLHLIDLGDQPF